MSNSLPTPVASMQVTLKTGDQRTKCLPEPDAAPNNKKKKTKSKQQQQKQKSLPEPDAALHGSQGLGLQQGRRRRTMGSAPFHVHFAFFFFKDSRSIYCTPSSFFDISF